jgi:hypothetical protein
VKAVAVVDVLAAVEELDGVDSAEAEVRSDFGVLAGFLDLFDDFAPWWRRCRAFDFIGLLAVGTRRRQSKKCSAYIAPLSLGVFVRRKSLRALPLLAEEQ